MSRVLVLALILFTAKSGKVEIGDDTLNWTIENSTLTYNLSFTSCWKYYAVGLRNLNVTVNLIQCANFTVINTKDEKAFPCYTECNSNLMACEDSFEVNISGNSITWNETCNYTPEEDYKMIYLKANSSQFSTAKVYSGKITLSQDFGEDSAFEAVFLALLLSLT